MRGHGRVNSTTFFSSASLLVTRKITTATAANTSELGNLLLIASVVKSLSENGGTRNLDGSSIPLSESLVLQVLRRPSLDVSKKLDFFRWCSLRPNYTHSAVSYTQMLRSICRLRRRHTYFDHHPDVIHLLQSMKRQGLLVDSTTFKLLLDAYIESSQFDCALELLDQMNEQLEKDEDTGYLNTDLYSSVLVALLRNQQLDPALSIFCKVLEASSTPSASVCNELLVALRRADMREEFKLVFEKLREKLDLWGYNICIHAFGSWGDLGLPLILFREMKERSIDPDLCTYNSLIQVLCMAGKVKDALIVWEELKSSGHQPNAFTYRIIIQGCCKSFLIDDASKIFSEMQYNGLCPDTIIFNSLLDGLLKARKLGNACQLFEKMTQDGVRASSWTYNILIDGLIKNDRVVAAYSLFCDLKKKGQFVDGVTYSIIILCLCREGRLEEAFKLVEEMEARGFVVDLVTVSSLLTELHKHGRGDWTERLRKLIRDNNLVPTVLDWKANMETFLKNPQSREKDLTYLFPSKDAFGNFLNTLSSNRPGNDNHQEFSSYGMDPWSSSPYMDWLANQVNPSARSFRSFSLSRGRRVQVKGADSFDIDMVNTYLSIFLAKGKLSLACKLFEVFTDMGVNPVSYTYNSIMSSFIKKGYFDEAWGVLHEMGENVCPADIATYNVIIQGLGKMGKADLASSILDKLMKHGGYLDIVMYNTLINALGKAGCMDEANIFFEQMKRSGIKPDVVTYNTLINVHSKAGLLKEAYKFLKMMIDAGCPPNHVTDTTLDYLEKEIEKLRYEKASMRHPSKGDS